MPPRRSCRVPVSVLGSDEAPRKSFWDNAAAEYAKFRDAVAKENVSAISFHAARLRLFALLRAFRIRRYLSEMPGSVFLIRVTPRLVKRKRLFRLRDVLSDFAERKEMSLQETKAPVLRHSDKDISEICASVTGGLHLSEESSQLRHHPAFWLMATIHRIPEVPAELETELRQLDALADDFDGDLAQWQERRPSARKLLTAVLEKLRARQLTSAHISVQFVLQQSFENASVTNVLMPHEIPVLFGGAHFGESDDDVDSDDTVFDSDATEGGEYEQEVDTAKRERDRAKWPVVSEAMCRHWHVVHVLPELFRVLPLTLQDDLPPWASTGDPPPRTLFDLSVGRQIWRLLERSDRVVVDATDDPEFDKVVQAQKNEIWHCSHSVEQNLERFKSAFVMAKTTVTHAAHPGCAVLVAQQELQKGFFCGMYRGQISLVVDRPPDNTECSDLNVEVEFGLIQPSLVGDLQHKYVLRSPWTRAEALRNNPLQFCNDSKAHIEVLSNLRDAEVEAIAADEVEKVARGRPQRREWLRQRVRRLVSDLRSGFTCLWGCPKDSPCCAHLLEDTPSLTCLPVCVDGVPMVAAFLKRKVSRGQEIFLSYGNNFWRPLAERLLRTRVHELGDSHNTSLDGASSRRSMLSDHVEIEVQPKESQETLLAMLKHQQSVMQRSQLQKAHVVDSEAWRAVLRNLDEPPSKKRRLQLKARPKAAKTAKAAKQKKLKLKRPNQKLKMAHAIAELVRPVWNLLQDRVAGSAVSNSPNDTELTLDWHKLVEEATDLFDVASASGGLLNDIPMQFVRLSPRPLPSVLKPTTGKAEALLSMFQLDGKYPNLRNDICAGIFARWLHNFVEQRCTRTPQQSRYVSIENGKVSPQRRIDRLLEESPSTVCPSLREEVLHVRDPAHRAGRRVFRATAPIAAGEPLFALHGYEKDGSVLMSETVFHELVLQHMRMPAYTLRMSRCVGWIDSLLGSLVEDLKVEGCALDTVARLVLLKAQQQHECVPDDTAEALRQFVVWNRMFLVPLSLLHQSARLRSKIVEHVAAQCDVSKRVATERHSKRRSVSKIQRLEQELVSVCDAAVFDKSEIARVLQCRQMFEFEHRSHLVQSSLMPPLVPSVSSNAGSSPTLFARWKKVDLEDTTDSEAERFWPFSQFEIRHFEHQQAARHDNQNNNNQNNNNQNNNNQNNSNQNNNQNNNKNNKKEIVIDISNDDNDVAGRVRCLVPDCVREDSLLCAKSSGRPNARVVRVYDRVRRHFVYVVFACTDVAPGQRICIDEGEENVLRVERSESLFASLASRPVYFETAKPPTVQKNKEAQHKAKVLLYSLGEKAGAQSLQLLAAEHAAAPSSIYGFRQMALLEDTMHLWKLLLCAATRTREEAAKRVKRRQPKLDRHNRGHWVLCKRSGAQSVLLRRLCRDAFSQALLAVLPVPDKDEAILAPLASLNLEAVLDDNNNDNDVVDDESDDEEGDEGIEKDGFEALRNAVRQFKRRQLRQVGATIQASQGQVCQGQGQGPVSQGQGQAKQHDHVNDDFAENESTFVFDSDCVDDDQTPSRSSDVKQEAAFYDDMPALQKLEDILSDVEENAAIRVRPPRLDINSNIIDLT